MNKYDYSITKMFGVELEFFILDKEGNVTNKVDSILKSLKRTLKNSNVTKECGISFRFE
jgi:gamma-glutamyl:cysteine ligase YbdK (ATP-grasp superfamily)